MVGNEEMSNERIEENKSIKNLSLCWAYYEICTPYNNHACPSKKKKWEKFSEEISTNFLYK